MKKSLAVISGLLSAALLTALVGCGKWYDKDIWMTKGSVLPEEAIVLPTSANYGASVSVHDPSVFYDTVTQEYYAFGTHFALASSDDLISWKQEASDGQCDVLYGNAKMDAPYASFPEALETSVNTIKPKTGDDAITTTWAPDVIKIGDNYYMYYSLTTSFGSNASLIGRVAAKSVMGLYSQNEILVQSSGGSDPNCIDPTVFYDKDGGLWMVYGSHYAGIYIKQLDKNGLPTDDDFGTLLWKGGSTVVEGPYIFYNAELDYYYLMTTYGDLSTDYNMRVARSKNPDGPYEDVTGLDVATKAGGGNKLAGNYQFAGDKGYAAMGHNSVIKRDGKYLVVYHTRYRNGESDVSGNHNLRVSQLYFNEEGWPVLSPTAYAGEEKGLVTAEQIAGDYDVVVHTSGTDKAFVDSVRYTFGSDGTVKNALGESAGTWSLKDGYYVSFTLGGVSYSGVACAGWRSASGSSGGVICLTATSETGGPVWAQAVLS